METPAVIEIDPMLAPISGDAPTGVDIRADASATSPYYRIKDARAAARAAERGNIEDAASVPGEWDTVVEVGSEILASVSKDLEVAAWMTEALVRLHGFPGLRDGFRLITGFTDQYWDGLFPMPDEEGVATRVAAVTGLNGEGADGTLVLPIRRIRIAEGDEPFAFWQFEQATALEKVTDAERKQARIDAGDASMEKIVASVKQTPSAYYATLAADIAAAQQSFAAMNTAFEQKAGADAPPSGKIRDMMEAVLSAIRFLAADKLAVQVEVAPSAVQAVVASSGGNGGAIVAAHSGNGAYTREQAFADLTRIAEFFRKTEPHSPVSYTIDEAVRRAKLSLPELLDELIADAAQRKAFMMAAGIKPPPD